MRLKFPNKVLTALIQVSDARFIEGLDSSAKELQG